MILERSDVHTHDTPSLMGKQRKHTIGGKFGTQTFADDGPMYNEMVILLASSRVLH